MRNDEAFEMFVREHTAGLVRLSVRMCGSRSCAEDNVQEALIKCLERWGSLQPDPLPYVRRAVLNATTDRWRRGRRNVPLDSLPEHPSPPDEGVTDRDQLQHLLGLLTVGERRVILLRYGEGMSETETAAVLKVSPGTVKSQTHRGLARMRAAGRAIELKDGSDLHG